MPCLQSAALKNKKHWNSFTTVFFKDFQEVRQQLDETGKVEYDEAHYEEMLKQDMSCPVCGVRLKNVPAVKAHIQERGHLNKLAASGRAADTADEDLPTAETP
jgi:hypothetical protein